MRPETYGERTESVIARYLRGEMQFDAAANEIAGILRSLLDAVREPEPRRPPGTQKMKPLRVSELMSSRATEMAASAVLHASPPLPGGSSKQEQHEQRAQALLLEAARRADSAGGGAV